MNYLELFILAVGLSMDAFAAAICIGLGLPKATIGKSLIPGLYFGFFQAVMPLIGFMIAVYFIDWIALFDHWVAFVLLVFLGGKMIIGGFWRKGCSDRTCPELTCTDRDCPKKTEISLSPVRMLPFAAATSIDALSVGISFAALRLDIVPAVFIIGLTTFVFAVAGVKIGHVFGSKFKSIAEIAGGIILILIGIKILVEHTL